MKDIYLTGYSVRGIKNIDELVTLSFYKKVIEKDPDMQEYNIKGIYGMNGSGKFCIRPFGQVDGVFIHFIIKFFKGFRIKPPYFSLEGRISLIL